MCPKCLEFKPLTVHHCFPRRHYGNNIYKVRICRSCHDEIEEVLRKLEMDRGCQLEDREYLAITRNFLRGNNEAGLVEIEPQKLREGDD